MEAGGGRRDRPFRTGEDGLVILVVFSGDLRLHPLRDRDLAQGEEGGLEIFVRAVVEEAQRAAAGGGVVDDFRHQALVLAEIKLVADADLPRRIHDHVPQVLLAVQFPQQEHHDVRPGLLFLAVQAGREDFRVIEDEGVAFAEIIDDILEDAMLDGARLLVDDHQAAFVAPAGRFLRHLALGQDELELRQFHAR